MVRLKRVFDNIPVLGKFDLAVGCLLLMFIEAAAGGNDHGDVGYGGVHAG